MKLSEKLFVKILVVLFSPAIDKNGYLKLPRNKKIRFIYLFLFMVLTMIAWVVFYEMQNIPWKLPSLLIEPLKK